MMSVKTPAEIATMREAGRVVAAALDAAAAAVRPGVTLWELDAIAAKVIGDAGARSSFLGYHPTFGAMPYPGVLCLSVNEVIVHGLPSDRELADGDLLSIDCGAEIGGFHGDAAVTVGVGTVDPAASRLVATAEEALRAGIAAARPGARMGDIGHAIESVVRPAGYGLPEGWGGHGVGTAMHEDPPVPNSGLPGRGMRLREGLVIAIEPMLIEGGGDGNVQLPDGWSMATTDGSRAVHVEHTVAITADGPMILTLP